MPPGAAGRWFLALGLAAAILVADQATKAWALATLRGAPALTVVPGCFNLTFSMNTGGVFGLFAGAPSGIRRVVFAGATALALGAIGWFLHRWGRQSRLLTVALGLVAGGALGNLVDRLRFGSVIDFIDWYWRTHHWYTFNVADSAISVGPCCCSRTRCSRSLRPAADRQRRRRHRGTRPCCRSSRVSGHSRSSATSSAPSRCTPTACWSPSVSWRRSPS
jgi:signal peptidase II